MRAPTARQKKALGLLRAAQRRGERLSVREFALQLRIGPAAAHGMLRRLEALGLVTQPRGRSRSFTAAGAHDAREIPVFKEGGHEAELAKPSAVAVDPRFFKLPSLEKTFAVMSCSTRRIEDFLISPGDIVVLDPDPTGRHHGVFVAAGIVDGKWTWGTLDRAGVRGTWFTAPTGISPNKRRGKKEDDNRSIRAPAQSGIIRGFAVGIIAPRGRLQTRRGSESE